MARLCVVLTILCATMQGMGASRISRTKKKDSVDDSTSAVEKVGANTTSVAEVQGTEFCWKDSYGRGVGKIPGSCSSGQQRIGLLCYPNCPSGMKRFGFDCHTSCPSGFANQGLFCRRREYGRGAGYALWQKNKCIRRNPSAPGCEKHGLLWYPKCRSGYSNFGCCICRPSRPDCRALNMNPGIDLSCAKKIIIGKPRLGKCGSGQERQAGLCYTRCRSGYTGVGPVCWGQPPSGWGQCGMGAAKTPSKCREQIFGSLMAVGKMAMFISSLGTSAAGEGPAKTNALKEKFAELKEKFQELADKYPEVKQKFNQAKDAKEVFDDKTLEFRAFYKALQIKDTDLTGADMVRISAKILDLIDPSGISATVAAFAYPKCSKLTR